jgi:hypothetical protein
MGLGRGTCMHYLVHPTSQEVQGQLSTSDEKSRHTDLCNLQDSLGGGGK